MSWDQYSETPASNYISGYFLTGMAPSSVKVAGSDIMADLASRFAAMHTSGGSVNAQTVTQTRQWASLVNGLELIFKPGFTNTGAVTLAVDGLAAKNIFANGVTAIAGMIVSGVPALVKYDGTQFNLLNPQSPTGSYTGTYTGGTTAPTGTVSYTITADGAFCNLRLPGNTFTATSNAATFTITGGPAAINPIATQSIFISIEDNTADTFGSLNMTASSGTLTFGKNSPGGGGFTSSGIKAVGHGGPFNVVYSLIN